MIRALFRRMFRRLSKIDLPVVGEQWTLTDCHAPVTILEVRGGYIVYAFDGIDESGSMPTSLFLAIYRRMPVVQHG